MERRLQVPMDTQNERVEGRRTQNASKDRQRGFSSEKKMRWAVALGNAQAGGA